MARFLVEIRYTEDREKLLAVRPGHRDYLIRLADEGVVLVAGPLADDLGGVVLYEVADRVELDRVIAEDPYTTEGIVTERTIQEWKVVLGAWVDGK